MMGMCLKITNICQEEKITPFEYTTLLNLLSLGAKTIDRRDFILQVKKSSENLKEF